MSSSSTNGPSSSKAGGDGDDKNANLFTQVEYLRQAIANTNIDDESLNVGDNLNALLRQVDVADQVAQGVETKLDRLLEDLEELLQGFEDTEDPAEEQEEDTQVSMSFDGLTVQHSRHIEGRTGRWKFFREEIFC